MAIVIESGALYSSALVIEIALFVTQTNAIYTIFDGMAQVIVSAARFCLHRTATDAGIYRGLYLRWLSSLLEWGWQKGTPSL
jgi:hypothetical protein